MVYDLKGNVLDPIPLYAWSPKGKFRIDTPKSTVIVSIVPFRGAQAVVWKQTTDGKFLQGVKPGHLELPPDFSNEVESYTHGDTYGVHVFTFVPRLDSLYHYDIASNKLKPVFTLDFKKQPLCIHGYRELPGYFGGNLAEPKQVSPNSWITQNNVPFIVNKKTLKGSLYKLENDFLGNGNIETEWWPDFNHGYFVQNMDPGDLLDALEKVLSSNKNLSAEKKSKLTKLKNSITDNDNNYILYAKLKK